MEPLGNTCIVGPRFGGPCFSFGWHLTGCLLQIRLASRQGVSQRLQTQCDLARSVHRCLLSTSGHGARRTRCKPYLDRLQTPRGTALDRRDFGSSLGVQAKYSKEGRSCPVFRPTLASDHAYSSERCNHCSFSCKRSRNEGLLGEDESGIHAANTMRRGQTSPQEPETEFISEEYGMTLCQCAGVRVDREVLSL